MVRTYTENGRQQDSKTSTVLELDNVTKKPGRPRKNWQDTRGLKDIGVARVPG